MKINHEETKETKSISKPMRIRFFVVDFRRIE